MPKKTSKRLRQQQDSNEEAIRCCQLAKELEERGDYEEAAKTLSEFWRGLGYKPNLTGLEQRAAAEVLLRAGVLTGFVGSSKQIAGAQEAAKDLISESIRLYESIEATEKIAEAQTELGHCYWRAGAYDEARVILGQALTQISTENFEQRATTLLRSAMVKASATRFSDALRFLNEAAPLFEQSESHAQKGFYYMELAIVLEALSAGEQREDYADRALIAYTAASFHLEQAGHTAYQAEVENNFGFFLSMRRNYEEAHRHLDVARRLFVSLKDSLHIAQVDETRARVFLAQGSGVEAERLTSAAVQRLQTGGQHALLAGALTTQGTALARLGRRAEARKVLQSAFEVAEQAGALEEAGKAELTMIEELGEHLSIADLRAIYESADYLLAETQQPSILKRLRNVARLVISGQIDKNESATPSLVVTFDSFPKEVRTYCEQYLLYFIQFLQDLGIEATSDLKHEAGQVLFTVTPSNEREALEKIWAALKIYLSLPSHTISNNVSNDIAVERLGYTITILQRQLRLAEAELQARNATIEAQQLTINTQKRLLSGEIIVNSPKDTIQNLDDKDREEILKGVAAITVLKKPGFEINLPKIYRWLKELFIEDD